MIKQILASFIGTVSALVIVGFVGYASITGYLDSRLTFFETTLSGMEEKVESVFEIIKGGVAGVDNVVTDSKLYNRFFPKEAASE